MFVNTDSKAIVFYWDGSHLSMLHVVSVSLSLRALNFLVAIVAKFCSCFEVSAGFMS